MKETTVRVRPLGRAVDYDEILDIQRRVWGHGETDLTPTHQFRITARLGAILLGGWVGNRLAGFVYSFPAVFEGRLVQHSHLLAVLPEYQGRGVGRSLKWAQRDKAIELGYDLITWTFDPLQAKNANLNIHSLGAVARTYWRDFYGAQEALVLGPGVRTDRFLAEWAIRSGRVASRRAGRAARTIPRSAAWALARKNAAPVGADGDDAPKPPVAEGEPPKAGEPTGLVPRGRGARGASPSGPAGAPARGGNPARNVAAALPGKADLTPAGRVVLAEIPRAVNTLQDRPQVIVAWQRGLRRALEHYLARGYIVDDFVFGDRCFYVLKRGRAAE